MGIEKGTIRYNDKQIADAPYDKTSTALVKDFTNNGYTILMNNQTYTNVPTLGGTCSINETVKIVIPQNNYNNMFILKTPTASGDSFVTSVNSRNGDVILSKSDVGLGNVDNTSDANKPISTATQTALNNKVSANSPALTGTPTAPTASVGNNTTQIATTAFVNAEIANDATPISHVGSTGTAHGAVTTSVNGFMISTDKTKLDGIESGAEVNNISDTNATDLTDGGNTTLHYHSADRDRANHTGTQLSSTISDFASTVLSTVLTGLSTATSAIISASDTVLTALGKLQAQITSHVGNTSNPHSTTASQVGLGNVTNESKTTMFTSPTFTGTATATIFAGNLSGNATSSSMVFDSAYKNIVNPAGGLYRTMDATKTGAIAITLPVGMTNTMMNVTIKIYEYVTNEAFEVNCGGYNDVAGGSNTWTRPFAYIIGNPSIDRRFTVRFGYTSAGKAIIYIGELASTWDYPQITVTEIQCGYTGYSVNFTTGWTVNFATAFENVSATVTGAQVGYALSTNTANSTVLRDASGNFSAGTITASLTGNASTATKLATARSITLSGVVNGSASFDGSSNITINTTGSTASITWEGE